MRERERERQRSLCRNNRGYAKMPPWQWQRRFLVLMGASTYALRMAGAGHSMTQLCFHMIHPSCAFGNHSAPSQEVLLVLSLWPSALCEFYVVLWGRILQPQAHQPARPSITLQVRHLSTEVGKQSSELRMTFRQ